MSPVQPRFVEVSRRPVRLFDPAPLTPNPGFVHMFPNTARELINSANHVERKAPCLTS